MKRTSLKVKPRMESMYFRKKKIGHSDFFSSGCTLLDCVLGGGWARDRIFNIVGDRSTAKTGLVVEAFANFQLKYPKGTMFFEETEAAFDRDYGRSLGFPDAVDIMPFSETIEEVFTNLDRVSNDSKGPKLFILDSLDAVSDKREQDRAFDKGDYNTGKAIQMSALFRKLRGQLARSNTTLGVVSQVRDKINVTFGKKQTRSGGKALDFYASQVLWLAKISNKYNEVRKIRRATGVNLKAKCEKNKVGRPFRECELLYLFEYGVDNRAADLKFLKECKVAVDRNASDDVIKNLVLDTWDELEDGFTPKRGKYE